MKISRDKHWKFLEDELKAQTEEFKTTFEARAKRLLEETGEMYVAIFESFHNNGSMVMKFPNTRPIPRKGAHLLCMLLEIQIKPFIHGEALIKELFLIWTRSLVVLIPSFLIETIVLLKTSSTAQINLSLITN